MKSPSGAERACMIGRFRNFLPPDAQFFLISHGFIGFLLIINYLCLFTAGLASRKLPTYFPFASQKLPTYFPLASQKLPIPNASGIHTKLNHPYPSLPTGRAGLAGGGQLE